MSDFEDKKRHRRRARSGNKGVRILASTEKDIDALVDIETACFTSGPYREHRFDREQYRYYVRNPQAIVLLAFQDRSPVASLVALAGRGTRSQAGRILSIAVVRGERRRGIGRSVLSRGVSLLQMPGCIRIYLEVASRAHAATFLFREYGFKPTRHLPDYYGSSIHGTRMVLNLSSPRT